MKILVLPVVALATLALAGCSQPDAEPNRDAFYASAKALPGFAQTPDKTLNTLATGICTLLATGGDDAYTRAVQLITANQVAATDAKTIVVAASADYCPEDAAKIPAA